MATKSYSLLVILALLAATNFFGGATALGGRKSLTVEAPSPAPVADEEAFVILDTKDGEVVEIAEFAVDEHNKQHKGNLNFESVVAAAYTHTSKGLNYGLILIVNDGTESQSYNANVLISNRAKKLVDLWKWNVNES